MQNSIKNESLSLKKPLESAKNLNFAVPPYIDNKDKLRIFTYLKTKNNDVLNEILVKYRPFILKYARKYKGYLCKSNIIESSDLIAEAEIAFIKCIDKFDFSQGSSLSAFAIHYIEGALREFVMANSFNVKVSNSAAFKHLFFKINSIKEKVGADNYISDFSEIKKINKINGVTEKQINKILNIIQSKQIHYCEQENTDDSFFTNTQIDEINKINNSIFNATEESIERDNLYNYRKKIINDSLNELAKIDNRQKEILYSRFFKEDNKLQFLSKKYKLSPQRISYIEKQALKNLKKIFEKKNISNVDIFSLLTN